MLQRPSELLYLSTDSFGVELYEDVPYCKVPRYAFNALLAKFVHQKLDKHIKCIISAKKGDIPTIP